jgi:hypothetical protein
MSPARRWGPWRFDSSRVVLDCHDGDRWIYEVDLEHCRTSAEVLDWIMQVAGKNWATDAVLAGLVRALDEILDPQASLCGMGMERGPINVAALVDRR